MNCCVHVEEKTNPRVKTNNYYQYQIDDIVRMSDGREKEIYHKLIGIPEELLDGKGHPCPYCGEGTDRFFYHTRCKYIMCRHCFSGTIIQAVSHFCGVSISEAIFLLGEYLVCPKYEGQFDNRLRDDSKKKYISNKSKNNKAKYIKKTRKRKTITGQSEYIYDDMEGNPAFKVTRIEEIDDNGNKTKRMLQSRFVDGEWKWGLDGNKIDYPYKLSKLISDQVRIVFIVEGEKCADKLNELLSTSTAKNISVATTVAGGSGQAKIWSDLKYWLTSKRVYILSDHDEPGFKAARIAYKSIIDIVGEDYVKIVDFATADSELDSSDKQGYDVADWIDEKKSLGQDSKSIFTRFVKVINSKNEQTIN